MGLISNSLHLIIVYEKYTHIKQVNNINSVKYILTFTLSDYFSYTIGISIKKY